jgi:hypothetical protein
MQPIIGVVPPTFGSYLWGESLNATSGALQVGILDRGLMDLHAGRLDRHLQ